MRRAHLLGSALTLALLWLVGIEAQTPPSARKASALETELIVATSDDATLRQWAEWQPGVMLDTVTELRPNAAALAIVRVRGCQVEYSKCGVNVDYTIYRPDNSVYKEAKLQPVENGRVAPPLTFTLTASDPPGLYRVVATVRDLNARRTQRPERIFSLRIE
jgi:hypothetical protein